MSPFLLLLASYGMCFGLMNEKLPALNRILYRIPIQRDSDHGTNLFTRMFDCSYCTGFHTGWVVWLASSLGSYQDGVVLLTSTPLFALASSVFCYSLDTLVQWLEQP